MIVASYVANNEVTAEAMGDLIRSVHTTVTGLGQEAPPPAPEKRKPAVPVSKSVGPDYIVCLEDGVRLKMLKRYLRSKYDMSPDDYRRKWGLPPDYPMVAPNYAEQRRSLAKKIGLGTKRRKAR